MYKCHLPHPKDDKPIQAKGHQLRDQRAPVQDVGMTKTTTMEMMMTSMIQRMTKMSSWVPNLLMLLRVRKLRCVCHYQVVHEAVIRVWIQQFNYALEIKLVMWLFIC